MTGLVNFPFFHIQFGVGNEWRWHMIGVCWCVRRGSGYWFPSHFPIQNTEKCPNKCRFCTLHIMCRNFLSIFRSHSWRELYGFNRFYAMQHFFSSSHQLIFSSNFWLCMCCIGMGHFSYHDRQRGGQHRHQQQKPCVRVYNLLLL